jgi:ATP/maltotriose-dependent transcriptional regulator MalT
VRLEGRTRELARIDELLADARAGRGGTLILAGEAGIGKSALLDAAVARAGDLQVLRTAGVPAEAALPFDGLRALLLPMLDGVAALPAVQARALRSALAQEPAGPGERFAVGLATIGLLRVRAARGPILLVVDDGHWLDDTSRETMLFVARRLPPGVACLVALRAATGAQPPQSLGIPVVRVGPLERPDARELLERTGPPLAAPAAELLLDAVGGHPLAILELPGQLSEGQRAGREPITLPLAPGAQLEAAFARQIAALPSDTRRAVGVAATMEDGPVGWLLAALARLGIDDAALAAAERARTLAIAGDRLAFRHPLVRAAAYHATEPADRRAAHRALAEVVDDPRRRAWHLAAAAVEADEAVAAALEEAARHAHAVGGPAEAGAAYARAAELSTDRRRRGRRALAAAGELAVAGQLDRALALLAIAERDATEADRPRLARLRGNLDLRRGDPRAAVVRLTAEAERLLPGGDAPAAVPLLADAMVAGTMIADAAQMDAIVTRLGEVGRRVGGLAAVLGDMAAGEWQVVHGREADGRALKLAVDPHLADADPLESAELLGLAAQGWLWLGDERRCGQLVDRLLAACEEAAAVGRLPYVLSVRAQLRLRMGDWDAALADAEEAVRVARDTAQATILSFDLALLGRIGALRGDSAAARDHLDEALAIVAREGNEGHRAHALAALGALELAQGRAEPAADALTAAVEVEGRAGWTNPVVTQAWGDLIEALVAAGRRDEAAARLAQLRETTARTGAAWGAAFAARGALLLVDVDGLEAASTRATARLQRLGVAFELARAELLAGERLRRARRRVAARAPLRRALATFERLGAASWAARARVELEASGGRDGDARSLDALDEHQRRVARLVNRGLTNREVADAVHLSPKTIERQLGVIYRRLNVRSRSELAQLVERDAANP